MLSQFTQIGAILAGKYRVERVLGEGGMGVVLAVRLATTGDRLAMKLVSGEIAEDAVALERFRREARALMRINSAHVVRIVEVGCLPDGTPYMVMEYLEGRSLSQHLAQTGPLPVWQAADFALQICDAFAHAHAFGIVHRDLKPSNLYVVRRPDGVEQLKVIDFGIAKQTGGGTTTAGFSLTKTAQLVGSPRYMAPEQIAASKDVDARVDIWSIGVTLYEVLTGHPAFEGKTLVSLYTEITLKQPLPMSHYRSDLPLGLGSVVARCIQKEREDRYCDVAELACALKPFASGECGVKPEILASVLGRPSRGSLSSMPPSSNGREPLLKWVGTPGGESKPAPSQVSTASRAANDHVLGWLLLALVFTIAVVVGAIVLLRGPVQALRHPPHSATSHGVRK